MKIAKTIIKDRSYPNLMCFGNEPDKCGRWESCPDYTACENEYDIKWFSFMEHRDDDEAVV